MAVRRPVKRRSPMNAPSGTPMMVLRMSAMPETCSESRTISVSWLSAAKIN